MFAQDLLDIIDIETGEKIIPPSEESLPHADLLRQQALLTLEPERGSYIYWSTAPGDKWRKNPLDVSKFAPNRKYAIQYRNHGITHWFRGRANGQQNSVADASLASSSHTNTGTIIANLNGTETIMFTTRQALPSAPPVSTALSTSDTSCSLAGDHPFTVFLDWTLAGDRPISALLTQVTGHNIGIEIRDPERKGRRIGPPGDWIADEVESGPPEESHLVRLSKYGPSFRQSYTFSTKPKQDGLVNSDTRNLVSGKTYELTLRPSKWQWLYDDEVEDAEILSDMQRLRSMLSKEPRVEYRPSSRTAFRAE